MSAVIKADLPNFRPMVEEDIQQVMLIEVSAYKFPWTETIFRDCLRAGYSCWTLEWASSIAAYGIMTVAVGECHILNLCVKPQLQGNGMGKILLDHLLETARRHKAEMIFLEVRTSNDAARHLYYEAGFDEVGIRRNYYPAKIGKEDALIMARSLV
jgi:ribosomal-protein-alanine N-acetyltransferase